MFEKGSLKKVYNLIAEDWHKDHQSDDWWVGGTDKFLSLLSPRAFILDAGCGGGTKSKYFIEKGFKIVGIDFSEEMITIARREVPEGNFFILDIQDADKLQDNFDGIVMQAVLLHFPKKEISMILENIISKLNQGGYLYVAVKEKKPNGPGDEIKTESDYGYSYHRFFSYFDHLEVKRYLKNAGLKIVYSNIKSSGKTNWIQLIGQKFQ